MRRDRRRTDVEERREEEEEETMKSRKCPVLSTKFILNGGLQEYKSPLSHIVRASWLVAVETVYCSGNCWVLLVGQRSEVTLGH